MKIDSTDKVTSFDNTVSDPLGNEGKSIMTTKKSSLSDLNYTPYKPVNITGQAKKAYNHYLNRGVKPNVAAGIVGNLYKESGLNPTAIGDKGTAYGVAQWRGDRLSNLKNYAISKGKSHADLTTQLDFILDEKGENQVLFLMGNQSPEVAAKTFADKYERPNPQYADYSTRSSVAKQLGKMKYGGKIQLYPDGGKVKPIITNNPKDPRLVAYQDSLNLYNLSTAQYKKAKNPSKITGTSEDFTDIVNDSKVVKGNVRQFVQGDLDNNREENVFNNDEFVHPNIKPIGEYWWSNKGNYNPLRMTEGNKNFLYKKPNQPVVYQPKTEPKEQVIQKGSLMDSKSRVVKTPKGRVAYSIPKYPVLQDNKPVVSQELPIDSVALPNEDKYVAPVVKQKEYTRGQQSYELNSDYVKRLHTENVTGKKMKPKLIRNAFGGFIPKYALGAGELMGLVSQGMNLGAGFIDSTNNQENPNIAKSALSGFIKGNAALPGIGGILGGIAGIRDAKKQRELFQKKKDIENRGVIDYFNIRSKGILDNYNTQGEESSFYAKGGIPNPQYEVEHGEVIIGDDVKLTGGKQIASNLHKVIGKTHDQFNPNTVNGTGEDGQGGQFIFSNRLRLGNKTFANLAEGIAKQKSKAEEMMAHNDYIFKNTGQANAEIADAKLQQLAQIQEMMKGEANPVGQFKFGGSIPQYVGGGELTAEQAYEQAYKNLARTAKARASKAANAASKKAADLAYEAAYKTERKLASKVGENVVKRTASRLGGIAAESLGKLGALGKVGGIYATMATELAGDVSPTQSKPKEKPISSEVLSNLQKQGFTPNSITGNIQQRRAARNAALNPNELTIQQRRELRNNPTPQVTNTGSGNRLNLNKGKTKPLVDNPVRNQFNTLNPLTNKQIDNSIKLPNIDNRVDVSKVISPIRKIGNSNGLNTDDLAPVVGSVMSGINYFANQNMINNYKTQTPASLLQNPNYQYFDRSGTARNSVRGITNTIMNNPFLNQGTKQAALANSMNVINDVNQQELNRKQEYDRSYRGQQIETENRNAMILNQARQQTMQNENQKLGMKQDNLNNLFSNINTNLAEFQANKQQDKAMQYMSLPYFKRLGLTPAEQEQFKKNPTSFLMGESEVPKNKKGGRIKMKYC